VRKVASIRIKPPAASAHAVSAAERVASAQQQRPLPRHARKKGKNNSFQLLESLNKIFFSK
jgi:hypothetical protein